MGDANVISLKDAATVVDVAALGLCKTCRGLGEVPCPPGNHTEDGCDECGGTGDAICLDCDGQYDLLQRIATAATMYRFRDRGRDIRGVEDAVYIKRAEQIALAAMLDANDAAREESQAWSAKWARRAKESGYA